jgi:hypothetical protein
MSFDKNYIFGKKRSKQRGNSEVVSSQLPSITPNFLTTFDNKIRKSYLTLKYILIYDISNMENPRLKLLKTERRLLYLKVQFVPRCKHF